MTSELRRGTAPVDVAPLEEAQARGLAVSLGELRERALEVVARLGVVEGSPLAEDLLSELDQDRGPVRVEPILKPPESVRGDTMRGLIEAIAHERETNDRKISLVRWSFIQLLAGLIFVAAEGATLAFEEKLG